MKTIAFLFFSLLVTTRAFADVVAEPVDYRHGETALQGYIAYDDTSEKKRPGVLVVHAWRGLDAYAKNRAEQLAELGYVAFALDMYGKGVYAKDHEEAAEFAGVYRNDRQLMQDRARAGLEVLRAHPLVNLKKIAAIGYCFGGTTVLEMARAGFDVRGVVSFHGVIGSPTVPEPGSVKAKVLVLHGEEDPYVPKEKLEQFKKDMIHAGADWQLVEFGGAVHSFTVQAAGNDKSQGNAYDAKADQRSWGMMKQFFDEIFKP